MHNVTCKLFRLLYSCMLTRSSLSSENESTIIPNTMFRPMMVISMKKDKSSISLHPAMSKIVRWSLPNPLLSSGIICGTQKSLRKCIASNNSWFALAEIALIFECHNILWLWFLSNQKSSLITWKQFEFYSGKYYL